MLWQGGALASLGDVLIGISVTAFLTVVGIKAQAGSAEMKSGVHVLVFCVYAPALAVIIESMNSIIIATRNTTILIFLISTLTASLVHYIIWDTRSRRRKLDSGIGIPPVAGAVPAYVKTHTTTSEYHQSVVELEEHGVDFAFIQSRIAPYFLPPDAVQYVAELRFGAGNPLLQRYVEAQDKRRKAFFRLVARGAVIREIYPRSRLVNYVTTGSHLGDLWPLTPDLMQQLLREWQRAIVQFPNYTVAIADEPVPMKYHVIDRRCVVLHEPIGRGDAHRLNSVFMFGGSLAERFAKDFDLVWDVIDPRWRDSKEISSWIDTDLYAASQLRLSAQHGAESRVQHDPSPRRRESKR